MEATLAQRLLDYLRPRTTEMVAVLDELVRAESPSSDRDSQAPVARLLAVHLERRGYRVRFLAGVRTGGALFARPRRRPRHRPAQLLLGHLDTVWPLGTVADRPPELVNGRFQGPGAYDMKAGLVQALYAVEALEACEVELPVTPLFFVNTDEEIGSVETGRHIERLARHVDRVYVLEPSQGPDGHLKTARKGVGRFTIRVQGRAAHAGLDPDQGASAILELSLVIQKLFALNDAAHGITVNVGQVDGGLRPNVIAPESRAIVDVRVRSAEDAGRIEQAIHGLTATTPGTSLEIAGQIGRPPMEETPGNQVLFDWACAAGEVLGLSLVSTAAGGGSDANTTSQFAPTLDGLGAVGDGAHADHEFLWTAAMAERAALLACLLVHPPLDWPQAPVVDTEATTS